ncbi:MAG TPA: glycosyltransferase [Bacteroidales bacterium]|nr:glycosyltransferase [Bacteroidales bacterium]HCB61143.1 glycosyltransferase [Bacteroidales bacterium]HCY24061.1 glycosyltransferase [Bacteroidales bacterium]
MFANTIIVKKILVLCPYPENCAPSQRLKYEQYFGEFRKAGFDITVSSFINRKFWKIIYLPNHWLAKTFYTLCGYFRRITNLFCLRRYDIVYVHLWVTPLGFPVFEWLVKRFSKALIYDIDDMIFLGHSSEANHKLQNLKGKKKMSYLMKSADHVITSTPALEEFALKYNKRVSDIPTTLQVDRFTAKTDYSLNTEIILGHSGSHSTSKYLKSIEPVFEKLLNSNLKFKVLVTGDVDFRFANPAIPVETKAWYAEDEASDLLRMDIGLYPLTDEPWVYGKRGGKALLYMAAGLPVIATAIGTNNETFSDGETGMLVNVNDFDGWANKILELAGDELLRQKIGTAAREAVNKMFSVAANKDKYLAVLNKVLKDS